MVTEVVAAVIRRQDKILIRRRPANKKRALLWEFAGGKPEPGPPGRRWCESAEELTLSCGHGKCRVCL